MCDSGLPQFLVCFVHQISMCFDLPCIPCNIWLADHLFPLNYCPYLLLRILLSILELETSYHFLNIPLYQHLSNRVVIIIMYVLLDTKVYALCSHLHRYNTLLPVSLPISLFCLLKIFITIVFLNSLIVHLSNHKTQF